jgi:hypothetical protein
MDKILISNDVEKQEFQILKELEVSNLFEYQVITLLKQIEINTRK